jgi:hypothetical protein
MQSILFLILVFVVSVGVSSFIELDLYTMLHGQGLLIVLAYLWDKL